MTNSNVHILSVGCSRVYRYFLEEKIIFKEFIYSAVTICN